MDRQTERVKISEVCQFNNKEITRRIISLEKNRQAEQQQVARNGRVAKARVSEWVKIYFYTQ